MTKEEILEINKKQINLKKTEFHPMFIFLGGLPGSGKTLLIEKVKEKYSDRDFVIIEADLYRKYLDIDYSDRYNAVDSSITLSNEIEMGLLDYAIMNKKNIISISSLRLKDVLYNIIENKLLPKNYIINCEAIITNEVESIVSSLERYVQHVKLKNEVPRFVKLDYFKICCEGFENTIKSFWKSTSICNVSLFVRGKKYGLPIEICNNKINNDIDIVLKLEIESQLRKLNEKSIFRRIYKIQKYLNDNSYSKEEKNELKQICFYIQEKL